LTRTTSRGGGGDCLNRGEKKRELGEAFIKKIIPGEKEWGEWAARSDPTLREKVRRTWKKKVGGEIKSPKKRGTLSLGRKRRKRRKVT